MKRNGRWPIFWQLSSLHGECNLKTASLVPLFAKLANELNQCGEGERGGLICSGPFECNVLRKLANVCYSHRSNDEEYQQLVDKTYLGVMKKLPRCQSFQERRHKCDLIGHLCNHPIFPEQRFRYLADWDPCCLMLLSGST